MHEILPLALALIVTIVLLVLLADRIRVAYPILLVLGGLAVSIIPNIPRIKINPDWIFFIFLPPLLYEASWHISLKNLKKYWRVIGSFAFLVVLFTATTVAVFANHFIPGFSLALVFLLGGIVSPPDAVSAGAIMKFVNIPKTTESVLEGESLLNDASSLIIVRFALIAVGTGQFIWQEAILDFSWMLVGGAGIGLLIALIYLQLNKVIKTTPHSDTVFSIVLPYLMYWAGEQIHSSGVLAVVFGGLLLSSRRYQFLNSSSRLAGFNFWESFVFVLNGLVFMLIGLELPEIVSGIRSEGIPLGTAIKYGVWVTIILILVRIVSSYFAMVSTILFRRHAVHFRGTLRDLFWGPIVLGWTGMRGVVSLAAALAIPVYLESGHPFPNRNLILFITFTVILLTLIIQGLTLPLFIRRMKIPILEEPDEELTHRLRKELYQFSLDTTKRHFKTELDSNPLIKQMVETWETKLSKPEIANLNENQRKLYLDFLHKQRKFLIEKDRDAKFPDHIIRRQVLLLDLEEEKFLKAR